MISFSDQINNHIKADRWVFDVKHSLRACDILRKFSFCKPRASQVSIDKVVSCNSKSCYICYTVYLANTHFNRKGIRDWIMNLIMCQLSIPNSWHFQCCMHHHPPDDRVSSASFVLWKKNKQTYLAAKISGSLQELGFRYPSRGQRRSVCGRGSFA